jgi:hypothetical protein
MNFSHQFWSLFLKHIVVATLLCSLFTVCRTRAHIRMATSACSPLKDFDEICYEPYPIGGH